MLNVELEILNLIARQLNFKYTMLIKTKSKRALKISEHIKKSIYN